MRYGIIEHHEDGDDSRHPFFVVDSQAPSVDAGMLGPKFSRAEAQIIAFALSGIGRGGVLCVMDHGEVNSLHTGGWHTVAYDGPTAGVA